MKRALISSVSRAFRPEFPQTLGVAVSGGGDSIALLHLLSEIAPKTNSTLRVVTVNHNLRPEAADEADFVAKTCADLGVSHDILNWKTWDGTGNLQNSARNARYQLISKWARVRNIPLVALGHTADDQAETVLMRLARRSGVDGLSGMAEHHTAYGIDWCRPLLGQSREELREYLRLESVSWCDDPSNEDDRFDRIKARRALKALAPLGIDATALSVVASNMARARKALKWQSFIAARDIATVEEGAVVMATPKLQLLPEEVRRRLLIRAVMSISGRSYAPRREAVTTLLESITNGRGATLDGCRSVNWRGKIWVFREYAAAANSRTRFGELWDGRWHLSCDTPLENPAALEVRALGDGGLQQIENWREIGRPREYLLSSPSVWHGDTLVSAPVAKPCDDWHAWCDGDADMFFAGLLAH